MSEKLEPCPWCDGVLEYHHEGDRLVRVECIECECSGPIQEDMDAAALAWNKLSASVRAAESKDAEIARLRDVARAAEETRIAALEEAACAACPWCWNHRAGGVNWSKARLDSDTNRWVHLAQGYPPRLCTSDRIRDLIHAARSSGARGGAE